ncbi:MAG: UDP-N-acetylmuramate dehydrogenase [Erysipelotrichaceae bacterium]|nr:UDP-N-acetylmuramate dehydrogenase [Erysipelotrichaceae bacterium]
MKKETEIKLKQFGDLESNVSFKNLTTFRVGGIARNVFYPRNIFGLTNAISICRQEDIPFKVLGNGSNILASDDDFEGLIIKLTRYFIDYYFDDEYLYAQCGCSLIALSYKAMEMSLSGLEFANGIPATLGGALFMNAGAYKYEMSDVVDEVQVLVDDDVMWLTKDQCQFSYRSSIFQRHPEWTIVSCKLKLKKGENEAIQQLVNSRREKRRSTQPLNFPSAGSTFRNPEGSFAWKYIDEIGYRGKKIGGAQVSEKHSNFIINTGNATAGDIRKLADEIIEKVKKEHNIELKMEVEKFNWKE